MTIITTALIFGSAVVLAAAFSYRLGQMCGDDGSGCNGHHWDDSYLPEDTSGPERDRLGLDKHDPYGHYYAQVFNGEIILKGKKIRKCGDCGKKETYTAHFGRAEVDEVKEQ